MTFLTRLVWTGSREGAARDTRTFSRDLEMSFADLVLPMSAAPDYHGDATRANPEQLFVASVSACQALTYLFVAARSGVPVVSYDDEAEGELQLVDGKMRMTRVTLRPRIVLMPGADEARARALVDKAHAGCFIANSITTAVRLEPRISVQSGEVTDSESAEGAEKGRRHGDSHENADLHATR
jgi:organic hydroperoxide reductase OsmC/OhrA